ncbi:MAG: LysM peptidoglycan-binding domain-containing protein [Desulfobacteraceae bacterium]|nr:MAG: LysM peptidoglycan-binding domain-containing protein [Desulfobacteraceae bacterium]
MKPMHLRRNKKILFCFLAASFFRLMDPSPASDAIFYKSYIVRQDRGVDVLCDPYIVRRNDSLLKLFRQRGEIAAEHFSEFLEIFRRLNPHIEDINTIQTGEQICIPLKKLAQDSILDQERGLVTIPLVKVSNLYESIQQFANAHTVQRGESVSRLVANRFGDYGTFSYSRGIAIFKLLNAEISDLNRIYPGQSILLPDPVLREQPWYESIFDRAGRISPDLKKEIPEPSRPAADGEIASTPEKSPLARLADLLNGRLLQKGTYYIPRKGSESLKIDLSQSPLLELDGGTRILLLDPSVKTSDLNGIGSHLKNTALIPVAPGASMSDIFQSVFEKLNIGRKERLGFTDRGLTVNVEAQWIITPKAEPEGEAGYICINLIEDPNERTPESVSGYLKEKGIRIEDIVYKTPGGRDAFRTFDENRMVEDLIPIRPSNRQAFVRQLLLAMGVRYSENVKITFPYVGIQVEAISNLITSFSSRDVVVDFEDLYGDAIQAIEKSGLRVVQINKKDTSRQVIEKLLSGMQDRYTVDPTFYASERQNAGNTALTVPGFLLEKEGYPNKTLLAEVPLHDGIIDFLKNIGVSVIWVRGVDDEEKRIG